MGNKTRGICDIDVDGQKLKLQFSTNAMCELEDKVGKGFMEFLSDFQAQAEEGKMRMKEVRLMMWAGLLEYQPQTSLVDAGRIVTDLGGLGQALEVLRAALELAMPQPVAGSSAEGNGTAAAA